MSENHASGRRYRFHEVLARERAHLKLSPNLAHPDGVGLALSGGGIRSASFALGVVQALLNRGWFHRFDYLSTVSGGGYLGTALTWLRHQFPTDFEQQLGSVSVGARTAEVSGKPAVRRWLDYIRQHGNYLEPNGFGALSLFGVVLRGVLLSVFVYGGLIAILFVLLDAIHALPYADHAPSFTRPRSLVESAVSSFALFCALQLAVFSLATWLGAVRPWASLAGSILLAGLVAAGAVAAGALNPTLWLTFAAARIAPLVLTALSCFVIVVATARALIARDGTAAAAWHYRARLAWQRMLGWLVALLLALVFISTVPWVYGQLELYAVAAASGTLTVGAAVSAVRSLGGKSSLLAKVPIAVLVPAAALLALYALLVLGYAVQFEWLKSWTAIAIASAAVLVIGLVVDVNYVGPGRMYRDRLMEAFMPDRAAIEATQWQPADCADPVTIDQLADVRPYHLVNCNAVLADARSDTYRGRGGDSFAIAPLYSGSSATDWVPSTMLGGHRGMPLSTAMSISGAAVNPDAGSAGRGLTRDRAVACLMWIFNVRLGYWLRNPGTGWLGKLLAFGPPNFWFPGLVQGLFGQRLMESAAFLELSDGGHFDNTALYELIRRRTRIIVLSEAGADPDSKLEDLATAIERVRVDFGVHIRFDLPDYTTREMREPKAPGPYVARGFAIASIHYPPAQDPVNAGWLSQDAASDGILVYLQAVAVEALRGRPDLESYRLRNSTFPNETTANQFFTEEQLEAYRELGLMIANQAIDAVDQAGPTPALAPSTALATLRSTFTARS